MHDSVLPKPKCSLSVVGLDSSIVSCETELPVKGWHTRQDKHCRCYLPLAGKTIAVGELLFVHLMLALAVCYMNENVYSNIIIETEFVLSYICTCGLT